MSEVYWPAGAVNVLFSTSTWLAQLFTPLWTHNIERIRFTLASFLPGSVATLSLQKLTPAGIPDGVDLLRQNFFTPSLLPLGQQYIIQDPFGVISLIEGTQYALVLRMSVAPPFWTMATERIPPPSEYPRGKLIRSYDGGATWDTTDFGDMLFGEFGDPPLKPTPYNPPIVHWGVTEKSQNNFLTSACIRVATTEPVTLRAYITKEKPVPLETWQPRRGSQVLCLANYTFKNWLSYSQLEKTDSLYHTFHIRRLKEGETYWLTFIAQAALLSTVSAGPIFKYVHPAAAPFTTIRRPNAPGDRTRLRIAGTDPAPTNWESVNEATPDEDVTFVRSPSPSTGLFVDLYNIPNLEILDFGPFAEVHLTGRVRYFGGYAYASKAYLKLKTHGLEYNSPIFSPLTTTWANIHWHVKLNPFTNLPWIQAEINDLQIGQALSYYSGVSWGTLTDCTQVYCTIKKRCQSSTL